MRVVVTTNPGLESITEAEVREHFDGRVERHAGFLSLTPSAQTDDLRPLVYRLSLHLGSASAVTLRFPRFTARSFKQLVRNVGKLDFRGWLGPEQTLALTVQSSRSRLYHTKAIRERVAEGLAKSLGGAPALVPQSDDARGAPEDVPRLLVRLRNDACVVALDPGAVLYRRGYRLATAKAPLRPDLAHGLLRAAGYVGERRLADPMCGSGTLVIEAARMASRIAPGLGRSFAFETAPGFDAACFRSLVAEAEAARRSPPTELVASDRDEGAVAAARANAERAGVAAAVRITLAALSESPAFETEAPSLVVCNPPYGERIGDPKALRALYARLGALVGALPEGSGLGLVCPRGPLMGALGLPLDEAASVQHGGLRVGFHVTPR